MTRAQAGELLRLLRLNYATVRPDDDVDAFWLDELVRLDYALAEQAVRGLIDSVRRWPTKSDLNAQLEIVREQAIRVRREQERADEADPEREPPSPWELAEIERVFGRPFPALLKNIDRAV